MCYCNNTHREPSKVSISHEIHTTFYATESLRFTDFEQNDAQLCKIIFPFNKYLTLRFYANYSSTVFLNLVTIILNLAKLPARLPNNWGIVGSASEYFRMASIL